MNQLVRPYLGGRGFSLIELMIVIVIIGALSAVAVPIYKNNVEHAKRTEAVATIGSIRSQLRIYYAQEGEYPIVESFTKVVGQDWNDIKPGELDGQYFVDKNFRYRSYDGVEFRIKCQKAGILERQVWLDETGGWKFDVDEDDID